MKLKYYELPKGERPKLYAFCDASFANEEDYHSRTGRVTFFNGCAMTWMSKKQGLVTTSTYESEYVAVSNTIHEILWIRDFFAELGTEVEPPTVFGDKQGVVLSSASTVPDILTKALGKNLLYTHLPFLSHDDRYLIRAIEARITPSNSVKEELQSYRVQGTVGVRKPIAGYAFAPSSEMTRVQL